MPRIKKARAAFVPEEKEVRLEKSFTGNKEDVELGGPSSGHYGHDGRPGLVGGSMPGESSSSSSGGSVSSGKIFDGPLASQKDHKSLDKVVLAHGGNRVVLIDPPKTFVEALRDHARLSGGKAKFIEGRVNSCHSNSAKIYSGDPKRYQIVTGLALNEEIWREHTWVRDLKNKELIETTEPREKYFGITLSGEAAKDFVDLNPWTRKSLDEVDDVCRKGYRTFKSIDSGSLSDAGKLNDTACQTSGIIDDKDKEPEGNIKKIDLTPELDPSSLSISELKQAHWDLHLMYRKAAVGKPDEKFSTEDVVNLHARVIDELFNQGVKHPAPPDDGLDDTSSTFENHASEQPDWTKVEKQYQTINPSGNVQGGKIELKEVLSYFDTFKLRKPYIYLVGGLANNGSTEGDIDILVKDSPDLPEDFKHALHFRLGRALPGELAERLSIHYDEFHGPFTNYVELFDLTFERVNPENVVKEMRQSLIIEPEEGEDESEGLLLDEREKVYKQAAIECWEED